MKKIKVKIFRNFITLSIFGTLSTLGTLSTFGTFFSCSKNPVSEEEEDRPQIVVTGSIDEDTVWESGKDYIVKGVVTVGENATLTIEKDVLVYFDEDDNDVKGQLDVRGIINASSDDSTKRIVFQSFKYGQGVELQRGISLYNDYKESSFNHCVFNYLLYGIQGADTRTTVKNCNFENCYYAINISKCDSLLISHCEFTDNSYGIKIELSKGVTDSSLKISYNNFLNCDQIAIELNNESFSKISDNTFESCSLAILCQNYSNTEIIFNDFFRCDNCVCFSYNSRGNIQNNQFQDGDIFIYLSYGANPKLNFNNFEDVKDYIMRIKLYMEITINAENNWWGSVLKSEIEILIFDEKDDNSEAECGIVDFEPYETARYIENCGVRYLE